ncbi:MAG: hypothetical protein AAF802_08185 [Planctomycetota bacterium]
MKTRLVFLSLALLVTPVVAQEATGKKKRTRGRGNSANFVLKQFKDAELTDEQQAKVKELAKGFGESSMAMRKEAGLTDEVMKKRAAAQKELKDSGMKQKELTKAINEKAGLTTEQAEVLKKSNALRVQLMVKVFAMLIEEQQAKLPERIQTMAKRNAKADSKGEGKGKGKKKKKDGQDGV